MSNPFNAGTAIGGLVGTAAGPLGTLVGGVLGGLAGDAYSKKPSVGSFATTVRNDLAPENVTLDAHQIYVRITTGYGAATLVAACAAATQLSSSFADRANQIAAACGAAAGAWQGDASTAAAAATAPLSDSFAVAQSQLTANTQALNTEVAAFDHIRSQVEDVPAAPPESGIANSVNPFQTDVDAAINKYNAQAAKNVQLYEAYSADTAAARSQVPQTYAEPAPLSTSASAITRTGSPIEPASAAPPQLGSGAGADQPAATNASATPGESSAPTGGSSAPTGGASDKPSGTAASTDGTSRHTPSATVPTAATPTLPAARDTFVGRPLASQPRQGGTSDTQRKPSATGIGEFGAGPTPRGTGVRGGPSVGTGPIPGQTPAGQQIGRGAVSGARGAAGTNGMPTGPGGRGNGEEDQEHRRKYLLEPDGKDLFGESEPCVPPVIGDHR